MTLENNNNFLYNCEAEEAILGAALIEWSYFSEIHSKLEESDFYYPKNQIIFVAMSRLFNKDGQKVNADTITLIEELRKTDELDKVGGVNFISSLTEKVPTFTNIDYYINIVKDKAIRRDLMKTLDKIKSKVYDGSKGVRQILEEAEQAIFSLTSITQAFDIETMEKLIPSTIEMLERRASNSEEYTGIASGIKELDEMTSGFQDSEMVVVGARPSMGKTALALTMMQHIAVEKHIPTGFFSLEMSSSQIAMRLLSQISRVPGFTMRNARFSSQQLQDIEEAAKNTYPAPLYIVNSPNMRILDLKAAARRMVVDFKVKIIFIDYIGLITAENIRLQMYEQVSEISKALKGLARELNIPVIALCQVARDAEGQEPSLNQLRGSGSIEQDADMVMFIHRERKQADNEKENSKLDAKLIIAKQRNGPIGDIPVIFIPKITKFENYERYNNDI